ncbi:MAG: hypothetical protein Q8P63_03100 [Candidatus Nealsonbacteria bacterium]|nr:hypothetical protein [Candidatus Nealsonbacteria bacterium]
MSEENKQNKKDKCPLCQVSEESINILKSKGQEKGRLNKKERKNSFLRKLFKKHANNN